MKSREISSLVHAKPPFTNLATFALLRRSVAAYAITAINNCASVVWKSSLAQGTSSSAESAEKREIKGNERDGEGSEVDSRS